MNEEGVIYKGSGNYIFPMQWDFGQVHRLTGVSSYPRQDISLQPNPNQFLPNLSITSIHTIALTPTRTSEITIGRIRTGLQSPLGLLVPTRTVSHVALASYKKPLLHLMLIIEMWVLEVVTVTANHMCYCHPIKHRAFPIMMHKQFGAVFTKLSDNGNMKR